MSRHSAPSGRASTDVPLGTGVGRAPRPAAKPNSAQPQSGSGRSAKLEGTGVARAPRKVSEDKGGTGDGMQVLSYILSGLLLYGGLGWLGDWFFETSFLLPIGLILGVGLAIFMIIKRFGQAQ